MLAALKFDGRLTSCMTDIDVKSTLEAAMAPHIADRLTFSIAAERNSVQEAFLRRAVSALERISANVPTNALTAALSASTDVGALAQLLGRSEVMGDAVMELDPLAPALARNLEHRRQLLEDAGGTLSAVEVGQLLGISRQAVDKRRSSRSLLAVRDASDWRYPACQFGSQEVVQGIGSVVTAFDQQGPWVALDFLLADDDALGGVSPLQVLKSGDHGLVERLLRAESGDGFV